MRFTGSTLPWYQSFLEKKLHCFIPGQISRLVFVTLHSFCNFQFNFLFQYYFHDEFEESLIVEALFSNDKIISSFLDMDIFGFYEV